MCISKTELGRSDSHRAAALRQAYSLYHQESDVNHKQSGAAISNLDFALETDPLCRKAFNSHRKRDRRSETMTHIAEIRLQKEGYQHLLSAYSSICAIYIQQSVATRPKLLREEGFRY